LDRPEIYLLVTVLSVIDFEGCKNEAYRQARSEIRQAVFEAIEAGRFGKVVPMDIFALFLAIGTRGDAEMAHFLKKLSDRSLAGDPLEDQFWLIQAEWNSGWSAAQRAAFYVPFYERIRQLHPQQMFDRKTRWFYYGLAVTFFRGGRFDLARELLPAMAAGMTEQEAKEDVLGFRPNALYLLALLRQHEHNIPEALRLAQQAVELLGDKEIGLIWGTGLGGASGRGNTANLKSLLGDMIAKLRTDPEAKFVSPFDEK
jgi:tetratricopeptide (TPR) repeat protein